MICYCTAPIWAEGGERSNLGNGLKWGHSFLIKSKILSHRAGPLLQVKVTFTQMIYNHRIHFHLYHRHCNHHHHCNNHSHHHHCNHLNHHHHGPHQRIAVKDRNLEDMYDVPFEVVEEAYPDIEWGGRS